MRRGQKQHSGASKRAVADGLNGDILGQQSDGAGGGFLDVTAESTRQPNGARRRGGEYLQAGGHGAFGELEFADVALRQRDAFGEAQGLGAAGEAAVGQNLAEFEGASGGVHQAAAANAARRLAAEHVAFVARHRRTRTASMAPALAVIPALILPPSKAGPAAVDAHRIPCRLPSTISPLVPISNKA